MVPIIKTNQKIRQQLIQYPNSYATPGPLLNVMAKFYYLGHWFYVGAFEGKRKYRIIEPITGSNVNGEEYGSVKKAVEEIIPYIDEQLKKQDTTLPKVIARFQRVNKVVTLAEQTIWM